MNAVEKRWREFLHNCWEKAYGKACAPLRGIELPASDVQPLMDDTFRQIGKRFDVDSDQGDVAAFVFRTVKTEALEHVAEVRKLSHDSNRFCVRQGRSYDYGDNPDFAAMCRRNIHGILNSPELEKLFLALKPIAFGTFKKYGISDRDGEKIFSECLQKLTVPNDDHGKPGSKALLETLTVFEEVFPFFNKFVQNESIAWIRRIDSQDNHAFAEESLDAVQEDPDQPLRSTDPVSADDMDIPDFAETYSPMPDDFLVDLLEDMGVRQPEADPVAEEKAAGFFERVRKFFRTGRWN